MAATPRIDLVEIRSALGSATRECTQRGLKQSAKWAAQLLVHVAERIEELGSSAKPPPATPATPVCDAALLAKSYFDLGEYRRAAHALDDYRFSDARLHGGQSNSFRGGWDGDAASPRAARPYDSCACFLRSYALFLAGEKQKEEERLEQASPLERFAVRNPHIEALDAELVALCGLPDAPAAADGYLLYLHALVLAARERPLEARDALVRACNANPLIWSAWTDLAAMCADKEALDALPLDAHWMRAFFRVHALLELQENDDAGVECARLVTQYGESPELVALSARVAYNLRNFAIAEEKFEHLFERLDPYRFEGLETCVILPAWLRACVSVCVLRGLTRLSPPPSPSYSNVLYVNEDKAKLSHLAHRSVRNSKYRPETCCIVGNYYSLKGMHERAVVYFKRALRLDRNCLSAWTLMGHEFVELKQTDAAVEAYRRAVDIDPHDYRAWYGLGQTYEIEKMMHYALFYYRKACTLRPYDSRMWVALGGCYQCVWQQKTAQEDSSFDDVREDVALAEKALAIKCYKRALDNDESESMAMQRLAKMYACNKEVPCSVPPSDQDREAAYYFQLYTNAETEFSDEVKAAKLYVEKKEAGHPLPPLAHPLLALSLPLSLFLLLVTLDTWVPSRSTPARTTSSAYVQGRKALQRRSGTSTLRRATSSHSAAQTSPSPTQSASKRRISCKSSRDSGVATSKCS